MQPTRIPTPSIQFQPTPLHYQVSRRLARRLHASLASKKLGYVRIAVQAYQHLITTADGHFARLFVKELIIKYPSKKEHLWDLPGSRPAAGRLSPSSAHLGSVVGVLLSDPHPIAQQWGLQLLVILLKQQKTAEFIENFETLVPLLCAKAVTGDVSGTGLPISGLSLQALLEHLRLCFRVSYVSLHLDSITYAVLTIVDEERVSTAAASTASTAAADINPMLMAKMSIGAKVGGSSPGLAALLVYQEMGSMTRDAAEGKKVLDFLFRFLDQKPERWLGGPALEVGLGVMRDACSHEHQRYLLASALLGHVTVGEGLGSRERQAVLKQAMKDATSLDRGTIPSALLFALQELPKALFESGSNDALRGDILSGITALASRVGTRLQLTTVLGAAMSRLGSPPARGTTEMLACCAAAAAAYDTLSSTTATSSSTTSNTTATTTALESYPSSSLHQPSYLPNVLLRAVLGVCLKGTPPQRQLAHTILQRASKGMPGTQGTPSPHLPVLLSSLWYEMVLPDNGPAEYVTMVMTFALAVLPLTVPEDHVLACRFVGSLYHHACQVGGGALLSPAQQWAVVGMVCPCMWRQLATKLKVSSSSIVFVDALAGGGGGNADADRSLPSVTFVAPSTSTPSLSATAAAFTPADEERARHLLSSPPTAPAYDERRVTAALLSVPSLKPLLNKSGKEGPGFTPLPPSSISLQVTLASTCDAAHNNAGSPRIPSPRALRLLKAFSSAASQDQDAASSFDPGTSDGGAVAGSRFYRDVSERWGGVDGSSIGRRSREGETMSVAATSTVGGYVAAGAAGAPLATTIPTATGTGTGAVAAIGTGTGTGTGTNTANGVYGQSGGGGGGGGVKVGVGGGREVFFAPKTAHASHEDGSLTQEASLSQVLAGVEAALVVAG